MELAAITTVQVGELFLLIFIGWLAVKAKIIGQKAKGDFSNLLVYIIVPAMIVNSYMGEFTAETMQNLLQAFGLSLAAILTSVVLVIALGRYLGIREPIAKFAAMFSNAAYMGFPLIEALFGAEGLVYASAFVTIFNVVLWTVGYVQVSGNSDPHAIVQSIFSTPVIYAVLAGLAISMLGLPVPELIARPIELLGDMNTPVSMIITGMLIAGSDLGAALRSKAVWCLVPVRLLLIPGLCIALAALLGLNGMVVQVVLLLEACPCAAITSVFAVKFGCDETFASASVVLTTLLSIITLPICAMLVSMLV